MDDRKRVMQLVHGNGLTLKAAWAKVKAGAKKPAAKKPKAKKPAAKKPAAKRSRFGMPPLP